MAKQEMQKSSAWLLEVKFQKSALKNAEIIPDGWELALFFCPGKFVPFCRLSLGPSVLPLSLIDTYMCVAFLHSGGLKFENPDIFGLWQQLVWCFNLYFIF